MEKKQYIIPSVRVRVCKPQVLAGSIPVNSEKTITDSSLIQSKSDFLNFIGDNEE